MGASPPAHARVARAIRSPGEAPISGAGAREGSPDCEANGPAKRDRLDAARALRGPFRDTPRHYAVSEPSHRHA